MLLCAEEDEISAGRVAFRTHPALPPQVPFFPTCGKGFVEGPDFRRLRDDELGMPADPSYLSSNHSARTAGSGVERFLRLCRRLGLCGCDGRAGASSRSELLRVPSLRFGGQSAETTTTNLPSLRGFTRCQFVTA